MNLFFVWQIGCAAGGQKILRQRALHPAGLMVRGAVEPQHCTMQGVTRNDIRMAAVQTIPRQRVAEPGKVNADLMGTARYRKQETNAWEALAASTVYSVTLGLPSSLTQRPMMESPRRAIGTSMRPDPTGSGPSTKAR